MTSHKSDDTQNRQLKCTLLNARSIKNKILEFQYFIDSTDVDLAFVCETWLNDTILDSMLLSDKTKKNYLLFRKDRESRGGGICAFVKKIG